ncbi:MAG: hypothetical protein U5J96_04045 [Ignavibacteriaceae bacterium]|nr:hypothetical protein [Ignavibacteriaceae bacterium]
MTIRVIYGLVRIRAFPDLILKWRNLEIITKLMDCRKMILIIGHISKIKQRRCPFGGVNGFNSFYPEEIIGQPITSHKYLITDFNILRDRVVIGYDSLWGRIVFKK